MAQIQQDELKAAKNLIDRALQELHKKIIGQDHFLKFLLLAIFSEGHILVEGVPGIAKTLSVKALSEILGLQTKRIQFTPDLIPQDLIGTTLFNPKEGVFTIEKGPLFTHIVIADEINRAPAKVQSALLEVMAERQITIGKQTFQIDVPFFVFATQNPIEQEGTYPLSEAQLDRFLMKLIVHYPSKDEEVQILKRNSKTSYTLEPILNKQALNTIVNLIQQVYVDDKIYRYIIDIVNTSRTLHDKSGHMLVDYGASPRGSIALLNLSKAHALFDGREYVSPYDVKMVAKEVFRHRIIPSFHSLSENITPDEIVDLIFSEVAAP